VKVLITNPNKTENVLLVLHSYGNQQLWNLPGGGFKPEIESSIEAAKREVREELGLNLLNPEEIGIYETSNEGKKDTVYLISGTIDKNSIIQKNDEVAQVAWENYLLAVRRGEDVARVARQAIKLYFHLT
jgi:8-oxo-dGTP diphosphatase